MTQPQFHARIGTLLERLEERPAAEEWSAVLADGSEARVIAYPPLTGELAPGRRVWLNTTAVELGLGTGGAHFVLAPALCKEEPLCNEIGQTPERSAGHLMKLRYTPLQHAVLAAEEEASPHRSALQQNMALTGLPVLVAELHSMAMAAAIAARGCG